MNQNTITLDTPIKRGESEITVVTINKPNSGALRGASLRGLLDFQTDDIIKVLPRVGDREAVLVAGFTRDGGRGQGPAAGADATGGRDEEQPAVLDRGDGVELGRQAGQQVDRAFVGLVDVFDALVGERALDRRRQVVLVGQRLDDIAERDVVP